MLTPDKIEAVKRLRLQYKAVIELGDELEGIASLEQMADEAQRRLDGVNDALAKAKAKTDEEVAALEASMQKRKDIEQSCADMEADALEKAAQIARDADARAVEVDAAAKQDADAIRNAAHDSARSIVNNAQARADAIASDINEAYTELDGVKTQIDASKAELEQIQESIAKAREAMRAFVTG